MIVCFTIIYVEISWSLFFKHLIAQNINDIFVQQKENEINNQS
jgi:hypothetical protein